MNSSDLQIWNNAAFDNGDPEDTTINRPSWSPVKPIFVNRSDSLDSISSKENQSPVPENPLLVSVKTPAPVKPLHPNGIIGNSQTKPTKLIPKQSLIEKPVSKIGIEEEIRDEKKIDAEIEEVQFEINRLASRLEALRLEKADQRLKSVEKRGRIVQAKFMDHKQSIKSTDGVKKLEEPSSISKLQRRGLSLGPSEIVAGVRRGISLGPAEIYAGVKSKQLGKQETITPVQTIKNRRKSCFWKLENIDELKITKERGKSSSISPKSRKTISKTQPLRQAVTTVGSKKCLKKEDGIFSTIQPKKLFKDGEKSVPANNKKPLKPGRVIASRYNQNSSVQSIGNSSIRKRSLPENEQEERKRFDKKRASSVGKSSSSLPEISESQGTENRLKKRWEIPNEVVVHRSLEDCESPVLATNLPDMLPRIRAIRCTNVSPRDSGPAKRVAELVGKKSYFSDDEKAEALVGQALSFAEDNE